MRPELFVGNGPFRPLFWRLRDRLRVVRNEHYWDAAGVRAGAIDYLCVESAATMLNLYATGRADIVTDVPTAAVPALIESLNPEWKDLSEEWV